MSSLFYCVFIPWINTWSGVSGDMQQPLSLWQPKRQGKAVQGHQDCQRADWQTCQGPPGTLRGEIGKVPGDHPV